MKIFNGRKKFQKPRILVIVHSPGMRRFYHLLLENKGYWVKSSQRGLEGMKIAKRIRPDLILVEYLLPDIDGLELCQQIIAQGIVTGRSVLALSWFTSEPLRLRAQNMKIDILFMNKPFFITMFLEKIQSMLESLQNMNQTAGHTLPSEYILPNTSFCPFCRNEVRLDDNYCLNCGNQIHRGI